MMGVPLNAWTAHVHQQMLNSGAPMTLADVLNTFGQPASGLSARKKIQSAVERGYFVRDAEVILAVPKIHKRPGRTELFWNDERNQAIRDYYPAEGGACCIRIAGATHRTVVKQAGKLGVRLVRETKAGEPGRPMGRPQQNKSHQATHFGDGLPMVRDVFHYAQTL